MAKEQTQYQFLIENITDTTLKERIRLSLEYYIKNSNKYKNLQKVFTILLVILPALATFISCLAVKNDCFKYVLPGITALITMLSGISSGRKFADKQNAYRNYAENIKSILTAYSTGYGDYRGLNVDEKNAKLHMDTDKVFKESYKAINRIEKDISNSVGNTSK